MFSPDLKPSLIVINSFVHLSLSAFLFKEKFKHKNQMLGNGANGPITLLANSQKCRNLITC